MTAALLRVAAVAMLALHALSQQQQQQQQQHQQYDAPSLQQLRALLYPNQTTPQAQDTGAMEARRLDDAVTCVTCSELQYCQILNGYMVQEVYLPSQISVRATCTVLEQRATKYANTIFGPGRTFRRSDFCLNIVLQYLCLFWGSDNSMYSNGCINQEDYSDPDPANQKKVQRPPCRSFCVQIAELCSQDDNFIQVCASIMCPPVDESCVPSPVLSGTLIVTDLACTLPFQADPYQSSAVSTTKPTVYSVAVSCLIGLWLMLARG